MKEHALPQDVTGYRFHIIGNMTLKQFAEVAVGCVIGFLIYSTNLPAVIKFPLVLISAGIGGAMAFLPFEERPLDQWLVSAVRALYRPTQFYWQRTTKIPEPFLYEATDKTKSIVQEVDLTPARRQRVKEYLRSIDTSAAQDEVEQYTQARVSEVMNIFQDVVSTQQATANSFSAPATPTPVAAPISPDEIPNLLAAAQLENLPSIAVATPAPAQPNYQSQPLETVAVTTPTQPASPTTSKPSALQPTQVVIPQQTAISLEPTVQAGATADFSLQPATEEGVERAFVTDQFSPTAPVVDQVAATQVSAANVPIPEAPTEPNKIVGIVIDASNQSVSNAIVEVLTSDGFPARAVKTNVLGQFFITTPLGNGSYVIRAEQEGLTFPTQQVSLTGSVVPPVIVTSI